MVKRLRLSEGRLIDADSTNGQVHVYINPDESERRYLIDTLKLDEHTLNSALDPDELSRLEFEPDHMAVIYKRPKNYSSEDEFLFRVGSTGLFLFKDKLILVLAEEALLFDGKQFARVNSLQEIALKLIYRSIIHFLDHLKVVNAVSNALENKINTSMENRYLLNMFTLEKSLVYYLNAINTNGKVIERLKLSGGKLELGQENLEFLDDMLIENSQCYEQAEIYSNILASMMDARVSIVSNNLNLLMKTLNIITIGIMVPTLVVSTFSMNVEFPIRSHPYAFWLILMMACFSVLSVVIFFWWYNRSGRR